MISILCWIPSTMLAFQVSSCQIPVINEFANPSFEGIDIKWIDFNTAAESWEIELILNGENPTGIPSFANIQTTNFSFTGLNPATEYQIYIRAKCITGFSEWNGPYNFITNFDESNNCGLSFPIGDDNCPSGNKFIYQNKNAGNLGVDLFIEEILVTIAHTWPADLKLSLVSPAGKEINLISNLGINSQNLGDPLESCGRSLIFSDRSCTPVSKATFPIIGAYKPQTPIKDLYDQSQGLGNWTLVVCDRADGDLGTLLQFDIKFSAATCFPPTNIKVANIAGDYVDFTWENTSCQELEIIYGEAGFNPSDGEITYVSCGELYTRITDLNPDSHYEFYFNTICQNIEFGALCSIDAMTDCANPTLISSFDGLQNCAESCVENCFIDSNIWINSSEDDFDWLVNSGSTNTFFTGPEDDVKGGGTYLYLDSPENTCGRQLSAHLISNCINIKSNPSGCDLSFSYYMYGVDVQSLSLEISIDDGETFTELWSTIGNQGRNWESAIIDLNSYDGLVGSFRFIGISGEGAFGDIAIDEIKFFKSTISQNGSKIYIDNDGDGFGVEEGALEFCASEIPIGYTDNNLDCNDNDPLINPEAMERPCNLKDDNCNIFIDEATTNSLDYELLNVSNTNCKGTATGNIEIVAHSGEEPYFYQWSNGNIGSTNFGLETGVYQCTIQDGNGCFLVTDFIPVGVNQTLVYAISDAVDTSCKGIDDGHITLQIQGGIQPYSFLWSNGNTNQNLVNIPAETYTLTVTDGIGCELVTDPILIRNNKTLSTGVIAKKDTRCNNSSDGEIRVNTSGGTGNYTYLWNNGETSDRIENLPVGHYSYTVSDQDGCFEVNDSIFIAEPEEISIQIDVIESNICADDQTGKIGTTPMGGNPPYTFLWSNGAFADDIINLKNGIYNLTVADFNSCIKVLENIEISSPEKIEISLDNINPETCKTGLDGSIKLAIQGGSGNYIYNWSQSGLDTEEVSDLQSGIYSVTVIDDLGCKSRMSNIEVPENNISLDINLEIINNIDCNTGTGGAIATSINTGTPSYDLNWSHGYQTLINTNTDTITNLSEGSYTVSVTDNLGCIGVSDPIVFSVGLTPSFEFDITENVCHNESSAAINTTVLTGDGPFTYLWSNGDTTQNIKDLIDGEYQVTITDGNSCDFISQTFLLWAPVLIEITEEIIPASPGESDGEITLTLTGGIPPYTLSFNEINETGLSFTIPALSASTYFYSITDQNNCIINTNFEIPIISNIGELNNKSIKIFPNPTEGIFNILGLENEDYSINVYNLKGEEMPFEMLTGHSIKLDKFPQGLYILNISNSENSFSTKLFVK